MKFSLLAVLLFLPSGALALDADEIKALVAKPHDRTAVIEELKIYPKAREYSMQVVYQGAGEEPKEPAVVVAREKMVEGKYLLSQFTIPIHDEDSVMVVTYDRGAKLYRKWLLMPDGMLVEFYGTSVKDSRATTWKAKTEPEGEVKLALSLESHTDTQTSWIEIYEVDGKEVYRLSGVATVTKPDARKVHAER